MARQFGTPDRIEGICKFFDNTKGWGFLISDEIPDEDIFVHYRAIQGEGYKTLAEGEHVEFLLTRSEKGWQAAEVERFARAN